MQGKVAKASADLFNIPSLYEPDFAFAGGGMSSNMTLDDRYSYEEKREYEFVIPLIADGRQIAKATAVYTEEELNKREKFAKYRKGSK